MFDGIFCADGEPERGLTPGTLARMEFFLRDHPKAVLKFLAEKLSFDPDGPRAASQMARLRGIIEEELARFDEARISEARYAEMSSAERRVVDLMLKAMPDCDYDRHPSLPKLARRPAPGLASVIAFTNEMIKTAFASEPAEKPRPEAQP